MSDLYEPKVYKGLKLYLSCLWNYMDLYFGLEVLRHDCEAVLKSLVVFAVKSYDYFDIESRSNYSLLYNSYRKVRGFWVFYSNLLFFLTYVSNEH